MALAKGTKTVLAIIGISYVIFLALFFYSAMQEYGLVPVPVFQTKTVNLPDGLDDKAEIEKFAQDYVRAEVIVRDYNQGEYDISELNPRIVERLIEEGKKELRVANASEASNAQGFKKKRYYTAAQVKDPEGELVLGSKVELGLMQVELLTQRGIAGKEKIPVHGRGEIIGINWTMGFVVLNFFVLVALLYGLLWNPITGMLDGRTASIRKDIEQASASREDAEKLRARYEQALDNARTEAVRMREEKVREGNDRKDEIVSKARDEARRLVEDAKEQIESEIADAKKSLKQEIGDISVEIARNILAKEVNENIHRQMIDEFLRNLETEKV